MNEKAVDAYAALMKEIKYRTEAIDILLAGGHNLRAKIVEESCYLQLRMICEIIAIGCLIIHGDLPAVTSSLRKSYKADWIIGQMSKIHAKFYPVPLENEDAVSGDGPPHMVEKKIGFLTQAELSQLWHRSGDILHRGSAKAILIEPERPLRLNEIKSWRDSIITLLNRHTIVSRDEETLIHVVMNDRGSNEVGWNIMKAIDPASV